MRFIGLWNADHLSAITTATAMTNAVVLPTTSEGTNGSLLSPNGSATHLSQVRSLNGVTRRTLALRPATTSAADLNIFLTIPSVAQLAPFLNAGIKKHFFAVRVYMAVVANGNKYIQFGTESTGYFTATNYTEYFIEVVTDLVNSTRILCVNGSVYDIASLPGLNGIVHIGNYNTGLLTGTNNSFELVDAYVAVAETDEDAAVTRLGKFLVKTATLDSVTNDAKFTPVPASTTIKDILALNRDATGSRGTYVNTDSNESKLGLRFRRPEDTGVGIAGAALRLATQKVATNQAITVADVGRGETMIPTYPDTTAYATYTVHSLPTPAEGWSEDAIANLDVKIGSKRNL